jgi:hypothetical protein
MGRTKKYQTTEEAMLIQKKQVKDAQVRYKESRTCFRKHASVEQKALIKLLNHVILAKDDAIALLDIARNFKNSKLIADVLKEQALIGSSDSSSHTDVNVTNNINITIPDSGDKKDADSADSGKKTNPGSI